MTRLTCTLILFSAAALCGCAANAQTSPPGAASPSSAFAATSWSPTVKLILAESKAAMGGAAWNHIHSLRLKGTVKASGNTASFTELEDVRTGRWVAHYKVGPITIATGFDGKQGWTKRPSGKVAPDDSPAAKKETETSAYQTAHGYWHRKRWPARIEPIGIKKDDGKSFQVLRITPKGGASFQLWINAKTHLIACTVDRSGTMPQTTYYSNYHSAHGVKIAFDHRLSIGKKKNVRLSQTKKIAVNVPVSASDFAMPAKKANNISFIGGGDKATIPFRPTPDLINIAVSVNGHPLRFIVDTGGGSAMTSRAAKRSGVTSGGALSTGGYGPKRVTVSLGKVAKLSLGGKVLVRNPIYAVSAFPVFSKKLLDVSVNGSVGFQILKHFVVRVDYANHELTLIRPADFNPAGAGTAIPFSLEGGAIPLVKGTMDGLNGSFLIDTGTVGALSLSAQFAKKHKLYSRYRSTPEMMVGIGYGGKATGRAGRAGQLSIGGVAVHNPVIGLSTTTKGVVAEMMAKGHIAGIIGARFLRRFTATFDYAHDKMYLKPNKNYGKPMNHDRSGMFVMGKHDDFLVASVMQGGPAADSGLKNGDVITKVNGQSAADIGLNKFRRVLRNEAPGTKVKLTIGEGEAAHDVTITLRRLIPKTGGLGPKLSSPGS